jgi:hypothetical protein
MIVVRQGNLERDSITHNMIICIVQGKTDETGKR